MYPALGHSLGGGLAALVGTTFGNPVVAFESPGDKTAARRLHLPLPVCSPVVLWHPLLTYHFPAALNSARNARVPQRRSYTARRMHWRRIILLLWRLRPRNALSPGQEHSV